MFSSKERMVMDIVAFSLSAAIFLALIAAAVIVMLK